MPHASHLTQVMAGHEFQEAFKNYRDLRFLDRNLKDWEDKPASSATCWTTAAVPTPERPPAVQAQARAVNLKALAERRDAVATEVERAVREQGSASLRQSERPRAARCGRRREEGRSDVSDAAEAERIRERTRLVSGALTWRLAQEYPARPGKRRRT